MTGAEAARLQAEQEALDSTIEAVMLSKVEAGSRELKRLSGMVTAHETQETAIAEARAKLRLIVGQEGGGLVAVNESSEEAQRELERFLDSCTVGVDVPERLREAAYSSLQTQTGRAPDSGAVDDLALRTLEALISADVAWEPELTGMSLKTVQQGPRQGQRFLSVELTKGHFADTAVSHKGAYVTWPQPGQDQDDCQLWVKVHLPPSANGDARLVAQSFAVPWTVLSGVMARHPVMRQHVFGAGGGMTAPTEFAQRQQKGVCYLLKLPEGEEAAASFLQECPRVLKVSYRGRDAQVFLSTRLWKCTSCRELNGDPARGHLSIHEGECTRFTKMQGDRLARSMGGMQTDPKTGEQQWRAAEKDVVPMTE